MADSGIIADTQMDEDGIISKANIDSLMTLPRWDVYVQVKMKRGIGRQ